MRLQNSNSPVESGQPAERLNRSQPVSSQSVATPGRASGAEDAIELSSATRVLQAGSSQRASHLARLTELVRSGNYDVSAQAISRSLVSETLDRAAAQWTAS